MKRLAIDVEDDIHKAIKLQAVREGCGYRDLIVRSFLAYMKSLESVKHETESLCQRLE